jgi:hypothetical protein
LLDDLRYRFDRPYVGIVLAVLAAGAAAWYFLIREDDEPTDSPAIPAMVSVAQLRELAASVGHPVYWAGARPGKHYELTETSDGRIYVRYLPRHVETGDPRPAFLTVGTYPVNGATEALRGASDQRGAITRTIADRGLVVTNEKSRNSVYIAYPSEDLQIEVYDPSAKRALTLATSGRVRPVR